MVFPVVGEEPHKKPVNFVVGCEPEWCKSPVWKAAHMKQAEYDITSI
jgi:hypothetical protein